MRSRWLDIGQGFFLHVGPYTRKNEQGQHPPILTEQGISILCGIKHQKIIFDLVGPSQKFQAGIEIAPACPLTELQ